MTAIGKSVVLAVVTVVFSPGLSQMKPPTASRIDVRYFGAKGNGRTDDTAAIKDAFASLSPGTGTIQMTPGVYLISSTISPQGRFRLICEGSSSPTDAMAGSCTIFKARTFSGAALLLGPATEGALIEGVQVDGAPGNRGDGIQILANSIALRDVTVANQGGNGIRIGEDVQRDGTQANSFLLDRVRSLKNGQNGFYIHKEDVIGPGWSDANGGTMINCVAQANLGDGLRIGKAMDNTFIGMLTEANGGYGVHLVAGAGNQVFIGGDLNEGNHAGNVGMERGNVLGSYFIGTDTGAAVTDKGSPRSEIWNRFFDLKGGTPRGESGAGLAIGQSVIYSGKGAPSGSCRTGSLYTRIDGGVGSTFYICEGGRWASK